jgi:hypothetical protein
MVAILPSPGAPSPLSMDLTNNSMDNGSFAAAAGAPQAVAGAMLPRHAISQGQAVQQRGQQPPQRQHAAEFTRNITMGVPNLSTLVEEDEEEYEAAHDEYEEDGLQGQGATSASHPAAYGIAPSPSRRSAAAPPSPVSPYVLREMQRGGAEAVEEDVRNRWGFTPGAEDTLEVSFGK